MGNESASAGASGGSPSAPFEIEDSARGPDGFFKIAPNFPTRRGARVHVKLQGRHVSILRGRKGNLYAIDSICYHAGGPLTAGAIEEVGQNRECLVCPWHSYKIDLQTGEGLYIDLSHRIASKGLRQRTHKVEERADGIYVQLSETPEKLPSGMLVLLSVQLGGTFFLFCLLLLALLCFFRNEKGAIQFHLTDLLLFVFFFVFLMTYHV